ncbi:TPA: hypothetical protein ACIZAB_005103, partial [Escherichia coli]
CFFCIQRNYRIYQMNKKFTKTILSAAVAGLFLAGNASVQAKAVSTKAKSTEEYYTFGKQSDGTQYRLSRNDGDIVRHFDL